MSSLKGSLVVETPFSQAADLVERFFTSGDAERGTATLRLNAPRVGMGVDVVASFRRRRGPNETVVFDLHWEAADGGPFPVFDGTLTVAEDETYETCRLILEGSYAPPGRVAGAVFDAAVGSRIAHETAQELLERMRTFLRVGYEATEVAKRVSAARPESGPESPAARPASE